MGTSVIMFENLQDRLSGTFKKITGKARLTDDNIQATLREVRKALLEADVAGRWAPRWARRSILGSSSSKLLSLSWLR